MANPTPISYLPSFLQGFRLVNGSDLQKIIAFLLNPIFPSSTLTQFGNAASTSPFSSFTEEGVLVKATGNPVKGNNADITDDVLYGFVLPANSLVNSGASLQISIQGMFAANANNKAYKVWVNPTLVGATINTVTGLITGGSVSGAGTGALLFNSGVQTGNNVGWGALVDLAKFGATGSNTQYSQSLAENGSTHAGITASVFPTQAENAPMNIIITGASPTTGAANDVLLQQVLITANN